MKTAIYLNQHYRVLSIDGLYVKLLSVMDEIIEVLVSQVTMFNKLVKRSILKRKRISVKTISRRKDIPVEAKSFDTYLSEQVKLFKSNQL